MAVAIIGCVWSREAWRTDCYEGLSCMSCVVARLGDFFGSTSCVTSLMRGDDYDISCRVLAYLAASGEIGVGYVCALATLSGVCNQPVICRVFRR